MPRFEGFPVGTLRFLHELKQNNDRAWFEDNKQRYEDEVRGPALEFITAMAVPLAKISPHFAAEARKVGGSLMRIHRDVRFGKDKSPYKTNVGIQFRHAAGGDVHAPGFYLHIAPDEAFVGVGSWRPAPEALLAFRKAIVEDPEGYKKAIGRAGFKKHFTLEGETLSRPPKGFDPAHPLIDHLKRKDHTGFCRLEPESICDPGLVRLVASRFQNAAGYMHFLCRALGVVF